MRPDPRPEPLLSAGWLAAAVQRDHAAGSGGRVAVRYAPGLRWSDQHGRRWPAAEPLEEEVGARLGLRHDCCHSSSATIAPARP
jgi:hypothetical protein